MTSRNRIRVYRDLLGKQSNITLLRGTGMANTYVLGRRSLSVVDPGAASSAAAVLDFVTQELGRKAADVREIVVTHLHCDHIGGVAELAGATGARVALGEAAKPYVEGRARMKWAPVSRWLAMMALYRGTEFTLPSLSDLARMPWAGSPLARCHGLPFVVDRWLKHGEPLDARKTASGPRWKVVAAPGHTDDSICLHEPKTRALLSGDVILGVDGNPRFNPFFAFDDEQTKTECLLRRLAATRIFPGHGLPTGGLQP